MVAIKNFGMPKCCMNCEMFDGEYSNCDIMGDTQDFEYQWDENRPFDCPLVEAISKDQYEARLKADMVAMLTELQLEIEELRLDRPLMSRGHECYGFEDKTPTEIQQECSDIIQEKINALKGNAIRGK